VWPLNNHLNERERTTRWLGDEDMVEYHRLTSTYVNILLTAGFVLVSMEEWGPTVKQQEELRPHYARSREIAPFLLLKSVKPTEK
jgi:hypothetical protein